MILSLQKLWGIFLPNERRKVLVMLVLVVLMAGVEMMGVLSITPFLSVLGRPEVIEENPLLLRAYEAFSFDSSRQFTIALGLFSIALVISSSIFKTVTQHLLNRFVHLQRHSFSARLLSRYLNQPYEFFLTRNPAELSKNVLSEVDQLMFDVVQPMSNLVAQGAVILAMGLLVFWYDPLMALSVVGVLALLYGTIYSVVRTRLGRIGSERRCANGQRYQACNEVLSGIKDVKVTHSAEAYQQKFSKASRQFSRHSATNETLNQSPLYLVETVGYSGLILIAMLLLLRSNDIAHVLPALGLYGFAAYRMLPAAQIVYRGIARLKFSSASLEAIYQDLMLAGAPEREVGGTLTVKKEIRLRDITYAYPSSPDKHVFSNYDLVVPANTSVGIVGRSGAGKTTLMDILLGLLEPQAGCLTVDGVPIHTGNVASWQRSVGYVPQHIYLADATVRENIAFGVPSEKINMVAVEQAAKTAQIHDFVMNDLADGYDTCIGDRGVRLSGGQCQRIGIARALYRGPSVLFLDEATSALDPEAEIAFNESVRNLSGKITIIVISHQETALEGCNSIVHISNRKQPVA